MAMYSRIALLLTTCLLPLGLHAEDTAAGYARTDPAQELGEAQPASEAAPSEGPLGRLWQSLQPGEDTRPMAGADTDASLALQRDGSMASANPQAMTPAMREKAAARFLKTFDHAIPENVYGSSFKTK